MKVRGSLNRLKNVKVKENKGQGQKNVMESRCQGYKKIRECRGQGQKW